jgi:hypothetical protein
MSVLIKTCADIISELIEAHQAGKDVNLNGVRQKVAKRNKVSQLSDSIKNHISAYLLKKSNKMRGICVCSVRSCPD